MKRRPETLRAASVPRLAPAPLSGLATALIVRGTPTLGVERGEKRDVGFGLLVSVVVVVGGFWYPSRLLRYLRA